MFFKFKIYILLYILNILKNIYNDNIIFLNMKIQNKNYKINYCIIILV